MMTQLDFLTASIQQIQAITPPTLIYTPGGTRRQAEIAGIKAQTEEYVQWARLQLVRCLEVCFRLGVHHVLTGFIRSTQLAEKGPYRNLVLNLLGWALIGSEAQEDWHRLGCRPRIIGGDDIPQVAELAAQLRDVYAGPTTQPTVWFIVNSAPDAFWKLIISVVSQTQARSQADIIHAICHEDIPPASLWISSGKPTITADILPMLLIEHEAQCYWMQQPGYALDEHALRLILHDYAVLRKTWMEDKTDRYSDIETYREVWEQPLILGLGQRLGSFWYPESGLVLEKHLGES